MPKPNKGEPKQDYIKRCMSDSDMNAKYPDNLQRYAVCQSIYRTEQREQSFKSYTDYPQQATENAKIALRWAEKNGWGTCGTPVGKKRASMLSKREPLSEETIAAMASFERHRQNSTRELGDGCGRLMWLAWGGDEGIEWASKKLKEIRR